MGTYHHIANFDKKEILHPHKMGQGLKFYEFCGIFYQSTILAALCWLLTKTDRVSNDPRWYGDRIGIVSDAGVNESIYDETDPYLNSEWKDVSFDVLIDMCNEDARFKEFLSAEINYGSPGTVLQSLEEYKAGIIDRNGDKV